MLGTIKAKAERAARGAALSMAGVVCILIGLGFLTAALWTWFARLQDALFASVLIGLIYAGLGLILIAAARMQPRPRPEKHQPFADPPEENVPPRDTPPTSGLPPLAQAFVFGLNAGIKAGKRK